MIPPGVVLACPGMQTMPRVCVCVYLLYLLAWPGWHSILTGACRGRKPQTPVPCMCVGALLLHACVPRTVQHAVACSIQGHGDTAGACAHLVWLPGCNRCTGVALDGRPSSQTALPAHQGQFKGVQWVRLCVRWCVRGQGGHVCRERCSGASPCSGCRPTCVACTNTELAENGWWTVRLCARLPVCLLTWIACILIACMRVSWG